MALSQLKIFGGTLEVNTKNLFQGPCEAHRREEIEKIGSKIPIMLASGWEERFRSRQH